MAAGRRSTFKVKNPASMSGYWGTTGSFWVSTPWDRAPYWGTSVARSSNPHGTWPTEFDLLGPCVMEASAFPERFLARSPLACVASKVVLAKEPRRDLPSSLVLQQVQKYLEERMQLPARLSQVSWMYPSRPGQR